MTLLRDFIRPASSTRTHRLGWIGAIVVLVHAGLIGWLVQSPPPTNRSPAPDSMILASVVVTPPEQSTAPLAPQTSTSQATVSKPSQHIHPVTALAPSATPSASTSSSQTQPEPLPTTTAAEASPLASIMSTAPAANAATVILPSSDAAYLQNPAPHYPRLSRRLGEEGTVVLRVFINAEGTAEKLEIATSSGHNRLDDAALSTVQAWRFVPGTRAGVPEAMWFNVPVRFVLD